MNDGRGPLDYDDDGFYTRETDGMGVVVWLVMVVAAMLLAFGVWRMFG